MMSADTEAEDKEFQWQWSGFDFLLSVGTDRGLDIEARIDAALAMGIYRPKQDNNNI
jgi:hypothetical protein